MRAIDGKRVGPRSPPVKAEFGEPRVSLTPSVHVSERIPGEEAEERERTIAKQYYFI